MGVKIGNKHTDDFNLHVTDFSLQQPEPQTHLINVPGRNGLLDLTEVHGSVVYGNRKIKLTCVHKDNIPQDWHNTNSALLAEYHGNRCNIIFDSEKDYYYNGRLSVANTKNSQMHSTYTITADCDPYAYEVQDRGSPWIWDIFNFNTGKIYQDKYCNVSVDSSYTLICEHNGQMPVTVTIELVSGEITVTFRGVTYNLELGNNYIPEITVTNRNFILRFEGNGYVNIHYRGGKL